MPVSVNGSTLRLGTVDAVTVDADGNPIAVASGALVGSTDGTLVAGSDGTRARFLRTLSDGSVVVDASGTNPAVKAATLRDAGNSNSSTLGAGLTWTGTFVDTTGYSQGITSFRSTQAGTFSLQFSSDGVTADSTIGPYTLTANSNSPQTVTPSRRYYRATYTNTSGSTATLAIETTLAGLAGVLTSRLVDTVTNNGVATLSRSVLFGANENGLTYANVGISERDALRVELAGPLSGFGEALAVEPMPRVQIDATYGIQNTDTDVLIDGVSGSVTGVTSLFVCATGTGIGGYGVLRSRRLVRYESGQGVRFRFTAAFTSPGVVSSLQLAGAFTATDGLFFGFLGDTFGVMRRIGGATAIMRLTVTTGATGAGNITVTLNSVPFIVVAAGALSATATAERIAESGVFTAWTSSVSPTSDGATVTFIQLVPAVTVGTYSIAGAGTAGSFATVQAGIANDNTTGFVAQTAWNVDRMDGTGNATNPSGVLLDVTKLNEYAIGYYFAAGTIRFLITTPSGRAAVVHRILYPNSSTIPNQKNPSFRIGWVAASLGSTTALVVTGASASGFSEGAMRTVRDPYSTVAGFTAGTTEYVALAIRVRGEFANTLNFREVLPAVVACGSETANRVVHLRVYLNPTLTGTVTWGYVDQTNSCVERATPSTITPTGGRLVAAIAVPTGAASVLDLDALDLRMEPGDVVAFSLEAASSTSVCFLSVNWQER